MHHKGAQYTVKTGEEAIGLIGLVSAIGCLYEAFRLCITKVHSILLRQERKLLVLLSNVEDENTYDI